MPEQYEDESAFQFIRDVAVDWRQSRVLNGEIGEFVTIPRQARGADWCFLGSITNHDSRTLPISLDFLDQDREYLAVLYVDAAGAHWDANPTASEIAQQVVRSSDVLQLRLAEGGGAAISFTPQPK